MLLAAACSSETREADLADDSGSNGAVDGLTSGEDGGDGDAALDGGEAPGGGDDSSGEGGGGGAPSLPEEPGQLTAGVWDDNLNLDFFRRYRAHFEQGMTGFVPFTWADHEAAFAASQQLGAREKLDVALVIDTTGSMGDELDYLKTEFSAIAAAIQAAHPNAEQRWALVVYRDEGDEYVTREFDFTSELSQFQGDLADQIHDGGGDFPEAPDAALEALAELDFRTDPDVARLAFWVADAPHHDASASRMKRAVLRLRDDDIHVYPVASSGVDELSEVTMRSTAQLTLGRYLFLTDDSGIGGAHKEPTIPCYSVTHLDDAILRMVDVELTGEHVAPNEDDVLRTVGRPNSAGKCSLGEEQVEAF